MKLLARWIGRQCCMHGERAWRRQVAMAMVALLLALCARQQRRRARGRNGGSSDVTSLFTPLRPDQPGQRQHTTTMWRPWTGVVGH